MKKFLTLILLLIPTLAFGAAGTISHEDLANTEQHVIHTFEYANDAARTGASGLTSSDNDKLALQLDTEELWRLDDYSGPTWVRVSTSGMHDTISERTSGNGVVVDSVTLKDGNIVTSGGSITDSTGAISFGNENLSTTGTLGAGATTVTTFTSTGIDDNTTGTVLTVADTGVTILANTSDGSDTGVSTISGGGANSASRGAIVYLYGNENASLAGDAYLRTGNISGAYLEIGNYSSDGNIAFTTNNGTNALILNSSQAANFYGAATVQGAFTSLGIDDNATGTELSLGNTLTVLKNNTSDGSDTGQTQIIGGGGADPTRGAHFLLFGDNHATYPGDIYIRTGSVADGDNTSVLELNNYSSSGSIQLRTDNTLALTLNSSQAATFAGAVNVTGATALNGNTTIGNASGDTLTYHPAAWTLSNPVTVTGTWADLGTVTTADINGGTLSGATVDGGLTWSAAQNLNSQALTNVNIDSGNITGVTYAGGTVGGGLTWSSNQNMNNVNLTNIDIDSGAIDGTTIGASSKSTGGFTTLTTTGNATVGGTLGVTGAITATAGQIAFPATQNASSNANTLDDYQEGSFTPTITGSGGASGQTYSTQLGKYTKIGNVVYFSLYAWLTNKGTIGGSIEIRGLPETSSTSHSQPVSIGYVSGISLTANHTQLLAYVISNSTTIALKETEWVGDTAGSLTTSNLDTAVIIGIAGSYLVD